MPQLLEAFQRKIKVMEQKVVLLSMVGLLPEKLATSLLASCRISGPVLMLFQSLGGDELGAPMSAQEDERYFGEDSPLMKNVQHSDDFLNEGLTFMKEGLESEECVECGKCEDKLQIIKTLLSGESIDRDQVDLKSFGITEHTPHMGEA